MGTYRNRTDLRYLEDAAKAAATLCERLMNELEPGMPTPELETRANRYLGQARSAAPFKQFEGFGQAICVSLNAEIVNGPPLRERVIQEGDLVSIALGTVIRGLHGKVARTRYVGTNPPEPVTRLLTGIQAAIPAMIDASMQTARLKDWLVAVQQTAKAHQLTVIDGTGGFGIGKKMHEDPGIPNNPATLNSPTLTITPGTALVPMPMMTLSTDPRWTMHEDGWTWVTADGALSAHWAETLLMTETGLRLLSVAD